MLIPLENIKKHGDCPFKDGMNQLWRNQLLGLSIEGLRLPDLPFKKTFFSVLNHPDNHVLTTTLRDYAALISHSDRFSYFTSDKIVEAAKAINDPFLNDWGSRIGTFFDKSYWDEEWQPATQGTGPTCGSVSTHSPLSIAPLHDWAGR